MNDTRNTWEGVTLAMQGMTMPVMTTIKGAPAGNATGVAVTDANAWRLSVLGPITLSYAGRPADIAGSERTLLAILSRTPGEEVSTTSIIAGMWGSSPPDAAEKTVASHIARLRKALTVVAPDVDPTGVVVTMPSGYILALPPSNVDITLFERLVADGQRALAVGQPALAFARLDEAVGLWRGDAFADLADRTFARAESARLEDLWLAAIEFRVEAQLAVMAPSASEELVAEAQALVAEHWHREKLWSLLMTALFRLDRRADAIAAFREARGRLEEGLGIEPGADLRAVERAVNANDDALLGTPVEASIVPEALTATVPACVGRAEELEWLCTSLDLAATRRGQARLVIGPAGIGKTRLLAELAQRAAERGIIVRFVRFGRGADATGALLAGPDRVTLQILDDMDAAPHEDQQTVAAFIRSTVTSPVVTIVSCRDPVRVGDLASLPKLVLSPLDDAAVAEIVRIYAPATTDATSASAMVNTGGVPARVHRAASEWAFGRAGRRIDRAVADAVEPRRRLTTVHDEVVAGVLDLAHVRTQARPLRPAPGPVTTCPYKGLAPFERADADLFHGREALVAEMVACLAEAPFLAIVGGSASGKSSLLRAGLLPALAAGVLPDSGQWHQILVTPDSAPPLNERLAEAADQPTLFVVDQFEQVFTALDADARGPFLAALANAAESGRVVIALRSEFYVRCGELPVLSRLIAANTVLMRPMATEELRRAIERPAALASVTVEGELLDQLVRDAQSVAGTLAGFSTALMSVWENRADRTITLAAYRASGGVTRAVETLADAAFAALRSDEDRDAAGRILLALTTSGPGSPGAATGVVARAVARAELIAAAGVRGPAVLDHLAEHRVVNLADERVELAHEVLVSEWPRLRTWLEDRALEASLGGRLAAAASAWAAASGRADRVYRGARLVVALDWAQAHPDAVGAREKEFLAASQRALLAEESRRQRRVHRFRQWFAAMVVALLLALAVAGVAIWQVIEARDAQSRADAQRLGAEALAEPDLRRALLLAVAGTAMAGAGAGDATAALRGVLLRSPDLIASAGSGLTALALSPDGRTLAAGSDAGAVWFLDAESLRPTARTDYPGHAPINGLAFLPDGRQLVTWGGGRGGTQGEGQAASIVVWDVASHQPEGPPFGQAWPGRPGGVLADGETLLVTQLGEDGKPANAIAWSTQARTPSTAYDLPTGSVDGLAVTPDGRRIALGTADGTLVVDLETGITRRLQDAMHPTALSPDGQILVTTQGADVVVWDVSSARRDGEARRHTGDVLSAAWSADGRWLASVGADGLVVVWDARTLQPSRVLTGHHGPVLMAHFAPDNRTLYTVGDDGSVLAWDLTGTRGVGSRLDAASDEASLVRLACALAGRDMSHEEWQRFLPDRPYQHVCPG